MGFGGCRLGAAGSVGRPPSAPSPPVWTEGHIWRRSGPGGRSSQFRGHAGAPDREEGESCPSHGTARWCVRVSEKYKAIWQRLPFTHPLPSIKSYPNPRPPMSAPSKSKPTPTYRPRRGSENIIGPGDTVRKGEFSTQPARPNAFTAGAVNDRNAKPARARYAEKNPVTASQGTAVRQHGRNGATRLVPCWSGAGLE